MLAFQKILCPVDFSDESEIAIKQVARLTEGGGAAVQLLHIVEPIIYPVEYGIGRLPGVDLESTISDKAAEKLAELAELLPGVDANVRVEFGAPWRRICEIAKEDEVDLIVLATHGLTGLEHFFVGSVAERVVGRAPCPVLTVKKT